MQDRPDAGELALALAQFLAEEVRPAVPPELRFQVLVAANSAAILAREFGAGEEAVRAEAERMLSLLDREGGEDARALQAEVAGAIRAGELDERFDEALAVLRESVRAKLAVAHPGYDEFADDGRS